MNGWLPGCDVNRENWDWVVEDKRLTPLGLGGGRVLVTGKLKAN